MPAVTVLDLDALAELQATALLQWNPVPTGPPLEPLVAKVFGYCCGCEVVGPVCAPVPRLSATWACACPCERYVRLPHSPH